MGKDLNTKMKNSGSTEQPKSNGDFGIKQRVEVNKSNCTSPVKDTLIQKYKLLMDAIRNAEIGKVDI